MWYNLSGRAYLILGHYSVIKMDVCSKSPVYGVSANGVSTFGKVMVYPFSGVVDIIGSDKADFREPGWEVRKRDQVSVKKAKPQGEPDEASMLRSMRRAKASVRRIALSNEFAWFVTLTLDQKKIDRYDDAAVVRKLNQWCSNQVKRRGLKYVLVPERHKDGALHFHGFFNDVLEARESGHTDSNSHMIFNLPGWTLGFTAAIRIYGDYAQAVGYVCKYIGKQGDKPCGRWYYSGGELVKPDVAYVDISAADVLERHAGAAYEMRVPGRRLAIVRDAERRLEDGTGDLQDVGRDGLFEQMEGLCVPRGGCGVHAQV